MTKLFQVNIIDGKNPSHEQMSVSKYFFTRDLAEAWCIEATRVSTNTYITSIAECYVNETKFTGINPDLKGGTGW